MKQGVKIPETVPATTLAGFLGISPQRASEMVKEGKIPSSGEKGAIPFKAAILAVVQDLRQQAKGKYPGEIDTRARREKAEADSAELETAKLADELILKADAELIWRDSAVEVRRAVEEADYLKPAQKKRLLATIAKIGQADG